MSTQKIALLGATGGTGLQVLTQALSQGHEVTVLVRSRERLGAAAGRARVLVGSVPDDAAALAEAVRGQNAVISTLGVGKSLKSSGLIARSVAAIDRAMEAGTFSIRVQDDDSNVHISLR